VILVDEAADEIDRLRQVLSQQNLTLASEESEQRDVGTELVRRVTHLNEVLEENVRLREAIRRLADQDATMSVVGGNVIVEMDDALTSEERDSLKFAINQMKYIRADSAAATLRALLERL
jgi:hypothetical protein